MQHGKVPPNLHLNNLNPSIRPFYDNLQVQTSLIEWPEPPKGQPRRASVNSFGFGGTNSHAIIEAYTPEIHDCIGHHFAALQGPDTQQHDYAESLPCALPLFISAASAKSLKEMVNTWASYLTRHPDINLQQVCWNTFSRRTALPFRLTVPAASRFQALESLAALGDSSVYNIDTWVQSKPMTRKPRILGVFTGQGSQWVSMSKSLLLSSTTYCRTIRQLDHVLQQTPDPPSWTLEQMILADNSPSRIQEAAISQPLCTALQLGLVDLLHSLGITLHAVVGHSSGEIAAVYAAGGITARDAILISYYRGLYAHLAGGENGETGAMLAAGLSEGEALNFCQNPDFGGRICVAANNAPSTVTLSGDMGAIRMAKERLLIEGKFARLLHVDTAYHSPHMIRPALKYMTALKTCSIAPITLGNSANWVSSVYSPSEMSEKDLGAGYWRDNMVCPVKFHNAVRLALDEHGPFDCAIEIGPHPALKGPVSQTVKSVTTTPIPYSGTLERSKNDSEAFSCLIGFLWCHLGPSTMSFDSFKEELASPTLQARLPSMPCYPWDHSQVHYRESRISRQYHFRNSAPHELLGVRTRDDDDEFELRWRNILRPEKTAWLEHHSFQGQPLLPASAYCVMALDAARAFLDGRSASVIEIRDLDIISGLGLDAGSAGTEILFSLAINTNAHDQKGTGTIEATFSLTSCPADGKTAMKKNMSGTMYIILGEATANALPSREPCLSEMLPARPEAFYKMMDETELKYSGPFRALEVIERRANFSSASLKRHHPADTTTLLLSPATLDTCLQSAFLTYSSPGDR
jgi:acyl transferase domain-containing protein